MEYRLSIMYSLIVLFSLLHSHVSGYEDFIYGYEDPDKNLIVDGDFEGNLSMSWNVTNAEADLYTADFYQGDRCVRVFNRTNNFGGISQTVRNVTGNTMYYGSAFIKSTQNPDPPKLYFMVRLWMAWEDTSGATGVIPYARFPAIRASSRWRHIGGDFITPDTDIQSLKIYFEVTNIDIDYLVDVVSLREIEEDPDWQARADANIAKHRMGRLTVGMSVPEPIPFCDCQLSVTQTKRHFGFGSVVQADTFIQQDQFGEDYRNFMYTNFEWTGFVNAMKWRPMEPTEGSINFHRVDASLEYMEAKNMTVRGHAVLWSVQKRNPDYVLPLTGQALRQQLYRRVNYLLDHYKGRVFEWDIVNEWLHKQFYDLEIPDVDIVKTIHQMVHELDPDTLLFLNDYQAARTGDYTTALVDQAQELTHKNATVDGIGIQSHLRQVPLNPEILRKRMQMAANGGYPVSITEMSVHHVNVSIRAKQLDQALRIYFSTPGVTSATLWLFSDQRRIKFQSDMVLFTGPDFVPNEAGQVWLDRMADWRTKKTFPVRARQQFNTFSAFYGQYLIEVLYQGRVVKNETLYFHPGDNVLRDIPLTRSDFSNLDVDISDKCAIKSGVNKVNLRSLGSNRLRQDLKIAKVSLEASVVGHGVTNI